MAEPVTNICLLCDPNKSFKTKSALTSHQREKAHSNTPNVIRLNNGVNELVGQQQDQSAALRIVEPQEQVQPRNSDQCEDCPESYST